MESWKEELYSTSYGNDLYHWGILGMKWGVRRYQNEDGSLTEAGKERYRKKAKQGKLSSSELYTLMKNDKTGSELIKNYQELCKEAYDRFPYLGKTTEEQDIYWSSVSGIEAMLKDSQNGRSIDMGEFGRIVFGYALDDYDQGFPDSTTAKITGYGDLDMALDFHKEHYNYSAQHQRYELDDYIEDIVGPIKWSDKFKILDSFKDKIVDKKQQQAELRLYFSDFGAMPKGYDIESYSDRIRKAQEIADYLPKDTRTMLNIMENIEESGMSGMRFDEMTDADWKRLSKFVK